jgi:hypothetical protein
MMTIQAANRAVLRRNENTPDGYYETTLDAFGSTWKIIVGYRVTNYGTRPVERMTRDGLERDEGESPSVRITHFEIGNNRDSMTFPMWLLTTAQESYIEAEIVESLEDLWK